MTIRLSAGLLHEYLAGRIDGEKFRREAFGADDKNLFDLEFMRGHSILQARLEPGGIDQDDDYVVLDLGADLAKVPKRTPPSE